MALRPEADFFEIPIQAISVQNRALMRVRAAENGDLDATVIVDPFDTPIAVTCPIGEDLGRLSHS
jgi:hypothetical protein